VLDNDNGTRLMVLGGSGQGNSIPAGTMTNGGKSKGAQFGVRHFF